MTRAFISILQLDFISAVKYNVLSVPLFFGIVIYCLFLQTDIIFGSKLIVATEKILSKRYMHIIFFSVLLLGAVINNGILK